jgi:hypothetical protein
MLFLLPCRAGSTCLHSFLEDLIVSFGTLPGTVDLYQFFISEARLLVRRVREGINWAQGTVGEGTGQDKRTGRRAYVETVLATLAASTVHGANTATRS